MSVLSAIMHFVNSQQTHYAWSNSDFVDVLRQSAHGRFPKALPITRSIISALTLLWVVVAGAVMSFAFF